MCVVGSHEWLMTRQYLNFSIQYTLIFISNYDQASALKILRVFKAQSYLLMVAY